MSASPAAPAQVRATTRRLAEPVDLVAALPAARGGVSFLQDGEGLVGWGEHSRMTAKGPEAASEIRAWFDAVVADLAVSDEVGVPGSGPIAFVSLGFDDSDESVAIVPSVVIGVRSGIAFSTVIGAGGLTERSAVEAPGRISYCDASLSVAGFTSAVRAATERIGRGELDKVVLAHDLEAIAEHEIDERYLLRELAAAYPSCWTYAVAGLVGASPEMLIRRIDGAVTSRVLAGTAWAEHAGDAVAADLMVSRKDLAEHAFAVDSVARVLRDVVTELEVPDGPHPLPLANLTHLATDITGHLPATGPSALEVAAMLHPTAAVGGTPTALARQVIRELEPAPRGRYAAPVGWLDAHGDGEFAIALRCAMVSGHTVRMIAGCGIVADSDPTTEAREAQVKMVPIRDALEAQR
ncbi:isochorismate synthase [Nakamurella panacisegetis]|uniref:isochorismate synthase n=1 Tax=Nakamurella panacisegetis TaxID=1090615 RepID=UPI0018D3804A|nr:isochorismate synthase [Nakamurella panacisegetis]